MPRLRASLLAICLLVSSPGHAGAPLPLFQWAVQPLAPTGSSSAWGVTLDHSGNSFVCGTFTDTLTLTTGTLRATGDTPAGNTDVFLVKYGPNGDALWARNGGNSTVGSLESGYGVAVDPSGNVYMTGEYGGAAPTSFSGITIAASGGGTFAVKYDSLGAIQWATSLASFEAGFGIATSGSSLVYVVGGGASSSIRMLNAATGAVLDTWSFAGLVQYPDMKISVDGAGNVIFSGFFYTGTVDFDPGPGTSNLTPDVNGDGFMAKYTAMGTLLWALKLTSSGQDAIKSHALAANGDIYFSGAVEAAATIDTVAAAAGQVVGKINSDGRALWMRVKTFQFLGSDYDLYADRIGVDNTGDYYITGTGLALGGGTIGGTYTIPGTNHFHIVRYDPAGAVTYAKFVTAGSSFVTPRALAIHGPDLYHVVGQFAGDATFDSHVLTDINNIPRPSFFIAQVGDVTTPVLASLATAEATPDRVRLRWYVSGLEGAAFVERRRGEDEWMVLGEANRNGPDYVGYEDHDVAPGDRLTYRLQWHEGGQALHSDPVSITVPRLIERLALAAAPNPANGALDALIAVPASGEATLAMHDILGRQVMERRVEADAAGRMVVRLGTSDLPAGLYWLSLRHGGHTARTRVSIVR